MADQEVSRAEFSDLVRRVSALEGNKKPFPGPSGSTGASGPTGATGTPSPPGENLGGLVLTRPEVVLSPGTYKLVASVVAEKDTPFKFLQFAVRGRDAVDLAYTPADTLKADEQIILKAVARGSGSYRAWVAWSADGVKWFDGPLVSFDVPVDPQVPPPPAPVKPLPPGQRRSQPRGKSRMRYNSLVFRNSMTEAKRFGAWRGIDVDGLLYFTPRQRWDDFKYHAPDHRDALEAGYMIVTTMPHAPESEGDQMNMRGANNGYKDQQRALGKWMAENGYNTDVHVIRPDWEGNGNWYKWSANRPGGAEALKQSLIHYVDNLRAGGCTKVLFDLCWNKGPSQAGADFSYFPGPEYIDIVAVDQYDMWGPSYTQADWDRENAKTPSIGTVIQLAKKHGIQWAIDEGGNTHGDGGNAYGKDNPAYWQFRNATILNNLDTISHDVTYDEKGAPATLRHDFASNPKSAAVYKQLWKPSIQI